MPTHWHKHSKHLTQSFNIHFIHIYPMCVCIACTLYTLTQAPHIAAALTQKRWRQLFTFYGVAVWWSCVDKIIAVCIMYVHCEFILFNVRCSCARLRMYSLSKTILFLSVFAKNVWPSKKCKMFGVIFFEFRGSCTAIPSFKSVNCISTNRMIALQRDTLHREKINSIDIDNAIIFINLFWADTDFLRPNSAMILHNIYVLVFTLIGRYINAVCGDVEIKKTKLIKKKNNLRTIYAVENAWYSIREREKLNNFWYQSVARLETEHWRKLLGGCVVILNISTVTVHELRKTKKNPYIVELTEYQIK